MQGQRDFGDLVEQKRARARGAEEALLLGDRAGEGAAHVPEQIAREKALGEGAAVDGHERTRAAAALVHEARDHFLAGARLARDHHDVLAGGNRVDAASDGHHGGAGADQLRLGDGAGR